MVARSWSAVRTAIEVCAAHAVLQAGSGPVAGALEDRKGRKGGIQGAVAPRRKHRLDCGPQRSSGDIQLIVDRCLIEVRKNQCRPTPRLEVRQCRNVVGVIGRHRPGRKRTVDVQIVVQCQADVVQIVAALGAACGLPGLLHRGQQQGNQDCDNGDDDQQFDEGERTAMMRPAHHDIRLQM